MAVSASLLDWTVRRLLPTDAAQDKAAQGMVAHSAVQQELVPAATTMEKGFSASSEPRADPP